MNLKILSLVIIGVCILLPDVCYAFLSKDVHLLNMQNGLADNTVSAVYKDKEGFVWFGTRNGLSRYDGRRITNFERSRSYPSISNLKEVFDGVLAFVDNGVFSAFDLKKERFLSVVSSSGQGILWIGTDGGGVIWSDLRMQFYNCFYLLSSPYIHSTLRPDIYSHLI
jgi:ligand-binding sensor domain-containing protein